MAIRSINLSSTNPAFARLAARSYDRQYCPVPNTSLPKVILNDLGVIFKGLTGEEMPKDDNTILVKADEGVFTRMFTPVLVNDQDGYAIRWGSRIIPLTIKDTKLSAADSKLTFKAGVYNFSGRGENVCLFALMKEAETGDTVKMPIVVRFASWDSPLDKDEFDAMFSEDLEGLLLQIAENKQPTGGQRTNEEILSFRDLIEGDYSVIDYREVTTSYGKNHILTLEGVPGYGESVACWGHSSIKNILLAQPVISKDEPAILSILSKEQTKDGKWRIKASLAVSSFAEDDDFCSIEF